MIFINIASNIQTFEARRYMLQLIKKNWLLIVIVASAFFLRVHQLGYLSIWVDEYIHVLRAKNMVTGVESTGFENNGLLLTYSIYPFFKIFGISDFWARFPSVLYAIGSIILLFIISKRLFNEKIAYITIILLTLSQYHIFWSRIARNYSIFLFTFLLAVYFFLRFFEHREQIKGFFKKLDISGKYLIFFLLAVGVSFLTHPLTFFIAFGVGAYCFVVFLLQLFKKEERSFLNKYAVITYVFIIGLFFIFSPSLAAAMKSFLTNFLPESSAEWVVPKWERLETLFETKKNETFDLYLNVIKSDYPKLFFLGFVGIIISFFINKKSGAFIFGLLVIPFLLMSYIYREPALPRYLLYIYPFFLMSIAVTIYFVSDKIIGKFISSKLVNSKPFLLAGIIAIVLLSPVKDAWNMVSSDKHGRVISKNMSHWYFTNWKEASVKVREASKPTDKIITTGVSNLRYYTNITDCYHYRQRVYDTRNHKYIPITPDSSKIYHANSLQGIQKILADNDRVWLVVDYYFDNVFSDPQAKSFLINMMEFKPEYSNNDIRVFLYDKNKPKKTYNSLVEIVHSGKRRSLEYFMNVNQIGSNPQLIIEVEGLNFTNELRIIVNKQFYAVPNAVTGNLYQTTKNPALRQVYSVGIPKDKLKVGQNSMIFEYTDQAVNDQVDGVTIYNLQLRQ